MEKATIRVHAGGRDYAGETHPNLALAFRNVLKDRAAIGKTTPLELSMVTMEGGEARAFNAWLLLGPSSNVVIEFPRGFKATADMREAQRTMAELLDTGHTVQIGDGLGDWTSGEAS